MGIRRVEHARSVFAVVLSGSRASDRVRREWSRWHVAPRPPRQRIPLGAPPPHKSRAVPGVTVVRSPSTTRRRQAARCRSKREEESEAGDVIDLGAPRRLRRTPPQRPKAGRPSRSRPVYTPNPRLYPGPRAGPKPRPKRAEVRGGEGRGRRRKRVFRRAVPNARLYRPAPPRPPPNARLYRPAPPRPPPNARLYRPAPPRPPPNARLYRPAPPRPPPPPARPRAAWPPPASPAPLDTASRAALRLSERRRGARAPQLSPARPPPAPPAPAPPSRRLVVKLPAAPAELAPRYRPASEHFRLRSLDTDSGASTPAGRPAAPAMDAGNRHSTSPEDCSDGNETLSAPSEFLAEFLSAIMRRQYAEALKYCRLILQYEPHNATARGFYPLLQHKVQAHKRAEEGDWPRGSSSEASAHSDKPQHAPPHEMMEQGADESDGSASGGATGSHLSSRSRSPGSCASQSSLELDSSEALAHSSPSLSISRRTEHTDSASGGCWESSGSASRSEPDDNGNALPNSLPSTTADSCTLAAPALPLAGCAGDVENDNTAAAGEPVRSANHKSDSSSSLRRLRAQFACSIK